jgi:methylenetetrahydrofolate reductase (NADPH)
MSQPIQHPVALPAVSIASRIAGLARGASVEINVQDLKDIGSSREFLHPGSQIYVSFLPKQTWRQTTEVCRALLQAGFDPVPHIPVRLLTDQPSLDRLVATLVRDEGVRELLLLAGDYANARGPFDRVEQVLETGVLQKYGLPRVSFAGHPEGHPRVPMEEIRRAERAKMLTASAAGLEVSFVSQFIFEAAPFIQWSRTLRAASARVQLVAGLAGPAKIATLLKFALRCGVGPSIRALGARSGSLTRLIADHAPDNVIRDLAQAQCAGEVDLARIHLFCFGGFLRTTQWLQRLENWADES